MEIMNYNQMLENANAVSILVNKTIECSKDYTDVKTDDVLDQIAEYLANTISDIVHDPICQDTTFRHHASGGGLSFASFGGDGQGAQTQFFFSCEGTYLRLYIGQTGYWWANKIVSDNGLKQLIKDWPYKKRVINDSLKTAIDRYNSKLSTRLSRQLELHDAIKNFQV